jgi:hypothetical protein
MTTARDGDDTGTTTMMVIMSWLLSIINEEGVLEEDDDCRQHLGNGDEGCNSKIFLLVLKVLFMKNTQKKSSYTLSVEIFDT